MKQLTLIFLIVLSLIFCSGYSVFSEEELLGTINGEPIYKKDLSLKEYMILYKKNKSLYELKKTYFEEYAFKVLLARLAKKHGVDKDEYLRTKVFLSIPPITNKEVEDYIKENKNQHEKSSYNADTLRINIKQELLEDRKNQKIQALKDDLFKEAKVELDIAPIEKPKFFVPINEANARLGPENAKINIVAFLDLQCPFCRKVFPKLLNIKNLYGDNLRLVLKHFPMEFHHNALRLAHEAQCAGEQGSFFEYVSMIFAPDRENSGQEYREKYIENLTLNPISFQSCLKSDVHTKNIYNDIRQGKELGVTSVPTIFINGYPIIGNVSQEAFEQIIEEELGSQ